MHSDSQISFHAIAPHLDLYTAVGIHRSCTGSVYLLPVTEKMRTQIASKELAILILSRPAVFSGNRNNLAFSSFIR